MGEKKHKKAVMSRVLDMLGLGGAKEDIAGKKKKKKGKSRAEQLAGLMK